VLIANLARAEESQPQKEKQWQFAGAVYLWGADLGGKMTNGSNIDVGFKDLVDNLEMGFMGAFEARNGRWLLFTDLIYLDISAGTTDLTIPIGPGIPVTTTAELDLEGWVIHLGGGYNLVDEGNSRVDLVGGARYLDLDSEVFLGLESLGPGQSITIPESGSVWDAFVGVKGQLGLGARWYIPYYIDVGTGESDFTWQASAGISFRAAKWVDLALVYRHLEWEFDSKRLLNDISFSGPAFGAIFRF
jgi:hypothetical protein